MPAAGWNARLLSVGNGGYAGTINYGQMASTLRLGYATASTDTGHQAGAEDASWAYHHPEKITDYGYRALHLTTITAKNLIAGFYGTAPGHAYFDSCSNGGREALMEAQRFPEDFDGILAGAPANNWSRMLSAGIDVAQTMTADPAGYIPAMKLPAIHAAALAACDAADGVKDGIVSDPAACRFDPEVLLCRQEDALTCLTPPQVRTLRKLYAGGTTRDGQPIFPGDLPGSELPGWEYWIVGAGPGAAAGARYPVNFFRYMVTGDPAWEELHADAGASLAQAQKAVGKDLDATDPDLRRFFGRGGKVMLYHGWNDAAISPWNSMQYVESVRQQAGAAAAASLRLYMVPGMEHCAGGPGPDSFGQLGLRPARGAGSGAVDLLQRWVEEGKAPEALLAAKFSSKEGSAAAITTRPLCPWPKVARYNGAGDPNLPESFTCRDK